MSAAVVRKRCERGSALLIVFVLAATIAIMLYMEMPVAVFEAQRQKEQLLIDRGNEYAHAVKLYVRKLGTYPPSMDALEKTNQMRFLRHRFKDPFTGKDDWRILHAGPNGMLIDSKVKQTSNGLNSNGTSAAVGTQNGSASSGLFGSASNTSGGGFGSNSGSAFGTANNSGTNGNTSGNNGGSSFGMGSFGSGGSNTDNTPPSFVVKPLPQRAPEMAANGSGQAAGGTGDQDPLAPLLPAGQADGSQSTGTGALPGGSGQATGQGLAGQGGQNATTQNATTGGFGNANSSGIGTGGTAMGTMGASSGMGTINTPGIAGVASRAAGHTIKLVNDQKDYSLWEFYYDPTKDATKGIANALGAMGAGQQANQQQNGISSPFGNNSNSSGTNNSIFGNSGGTSGASNAPSQNNTPTSTVPQQMPNQ